MIIRLNNYDGKYRIAALAKSEQTKNELLNKGLQVIMSDDEKILFYPENIEFNENKNALELLRSACEFDAFEISGSGNAYKFFDNTAADNAILVTNKCNSNCIMCPTAEIVRRSNEEYTGKELIELAKYISNDAPHITITGGEPFLIKKDMFMLLDYLKQNLNNTSYLLLTNGRAFCSKEYTELFSKTAPYDIELGIPLHGYNAKTHDSIVRADGAFNQTCSGIKNLLSVGARIELRIVVSKLNADFITNIAQLIAEEFPDVMCVKIIGLEMTGNAAVNRSKVWLSYPDAFKKSKHGIDIMIQSGINVGIYNFPLCSVDKEYWNICEKSISPNKIRFAKQCNSCSVRDACGGIFSGTIRLAKEDIVSR